MENTVTVEPLKVELRRKTKRQFELARVLVINRGGLKHSICHVKNGYLLIS